jgi:hypothetical protein
MLNIGFDKNTDASNNLYYNVSGSWLSSIIEGAVMIRPLFGAPIPVPVGIFPDNPSLSNAIPDIKLYPNPAANVVYWEYTGTIEPGNNKVWVRILDLYGRVVKDGIVAEEFIDVSGLQNGIYLIEFRNGSSTEPVAGKLFISR